jgi:hypothetical protein
VRQLIGGVGQGVAQFASGRDPAEAAEPADEFGQVIIELPRFKPAGALPIQRASVFFTQPFLNLVDAAGQKQDARGESYKKPCFMKINVLQILFIPLASPP